MPGVRWGSCRLKVWKEEEKGGRKALVSREREGDERKGP